MHHPEDKLWANHNKAFVTCISRISSLTIACVSCMFDDVGPEERLLGCKLSADMQVPLTKCIQEKNNFR